MDTKDRAELPTSRLLPLEENITLLLDRWRQGDENAIQQLFPFLYDKLRVLAAGLMKHEREDHTLQPTALVHEAYLSLTRGQTFAWRDRLHFYAVAGQVMRRILVDHARGHNAKKRGGELQIAVFTEVEDPNQPSQQDLLALDESLQALARWDARKAKVVELKWFAGLSVGEIAEYLNVSKPTVILDTRMAKAWLYHHIKGEGVDGF